MLCWNYGPSAVRINNRTGAVKLQPSTESIWIYFVFFELIFLKLLPQFHAIGSDTLVQQKIDVGWNGMHKKPGNNNKKSNWNTILKQQKTIFVPAIVSSDDETSRNLNLNEGIIHQKIDPSSSRIDHRNQYDLQKHLKKFECIIIKEFFYHFAVQATFLVDSNTLLK